MATNEPAAERAEQAEPVVASAIADAHQAAADAEMYTDRNRLKLAEEAHTRAAELYEQAATQSQNQQIAEYLSLSSKSHRTQSLIMHRRQQFQQQAHSNFSSRTSGPPAKPDTNDDPQGGRGPTNVSESFLLVQAPGMSVYQCMPSGKGGAASRGRHRRGGGQDWQGNVALNSGQGRTGRQRDVGGTHAECLALRRELATHRKQLAHVSAANATLRLDLSTKEKECASHKATIRQLRKAVRARVLAENQSWDGSATSLQDATIVESLRQSVRCLRSAVLARQRMLNTKHNVGLATTNNALLSETSAVRQELMDLRRSIASLDVDVRHAGAIRAEDAVLREGVAQAAQVVDLLAAPPSPTVSAPDAAVTKRVGFGGNAMTKEETEAEDDADQSKEMLSSAATSADGGLQRQPSDTLNNGDNAAATLEAAATPIPATPALTPNSGTQNRTQAVPDMDVRLGTPTPSTTAAAAVAAAAAGPRTRPMVAGTGTTPPGSGRTAATPLTFQVRKFPQRNLDSSADAMLDEVCFQASVLDESMSQVHEDRSNVIASLLEATRDSDTEGDDDDNDGSRSHLGALADL
eukprot:m.183820 g.183820  ORF g.183820 m.183820 type:complete len:579 (-) comp18086_c0_seq12:76-1812(-)